MGKTIQKLHNNYEHVTMWRTPHGVLPYALRIWCSECSNGSEVVEIPNGHPTIMQNNADRLFRNKGWSIGKNRKHDICPKCIGRLAEEKEQRRKDQLARLSSPRPETNVVELKTPKAEPPREMSREDRRIIISKLDAVYIDETSGYDSGWNDEKVARDLGVPKAWVTKLRDENFGPEASSAVDRALLDEAKELLAKAQGFADAIDETFRKIELMRSEAITSHNGMNQMKPQLAELQRRIGELEKKLS